MRGLASKRVAITGGASGIGAATVARFLEEGAHVAVLDRSREGLDAIRETHPQIQTLEADVTEPASIDAVFALLDHLWGGLDILINNAGISVRHPFLEIEPETWREVIGVNLTGVFLVARAAARRMLAGGGGVILNMGSTNGIVGYPYYADYNA